MELWEELWLALKRQLAASLAALRIGWMVVSVLIRHTALISFTGFGTSYLTIGAELLG